MSIVDLPPTLLQSNLRLFVRMTILQEREIKLQELPDVGSKAVLILGDSEWHYGPIVKARVYRSDKCTLGSATLHSGPGGALDLFCGYFSNSKLQS